LGTMFFNHHFGDQKQNLVQLIQKIFVKRHAQKL